MIVSLVGRPVSEEVRRPGAGFCHVVEAGAQNDPAIHQVRHLRQMLANLDIANRRRNRLINAAGLLLLRIAEALWGRMYRHVPSRRRAKARYRPRPYRAERERRSSARAERGARESGAGEKGLREVATRDHRGQGSEVGGQKTQINHRDAESQRKRRRRH